MMAMRTSAPCRRGGYTLLELLVASAASTVLLAGMASSVYIASQAMNIDEGISAVRSGNTRAVDQLLHDVCYAIAFTERTATEMTFSVPDRDGNGQPETIRYAWSGMPGDPLTYAYNAQPPVPLIDDVSNIDFTYTWRTLPAP